MELETYSNNNLHKIAQNIDENLTDLKQIKFQFLSKIEGVLVQKNFDHEKMRMQLFKQNRTYEEMQGFYNFELNKLKEQIRQIKQEFGLKVDFHYQQT